MHKLYIIIAIVMVGTGVSWWYLNTPRSLTTVFRTERSYDQMALTNTADTIVSGTFRSARTYTDRSTGNPVVLTEWQFDVDQVMKGPSVTSLTVTLTGGSKGPETTQVKDALTISAGQEAYLYLTAVKEKNTFIPVSVQQGIFLKQGETFKTIDGQNLTDAQ